MKPHSPTAPPGASKRARVPIPDRASSHKPRPAEGPAPQVPGASLSSPARAADLPEPPGSSPSSYYFATVVGVRDWHAGARESLDDLFALAEEGASRPRDRLFSRHEIRRRACDAYNQLSSFIDSARARLEGAAQAHEGGAADGRG